MHSSRMHTARSSSRPGGGLHQAPLLFWPSSVVAFCYGPPQKTIPEGRFQSEGHQTRRPPSIRRPPNQKAITEGHNKRPQQAITEGHTPQEQTPLGADTPQDQTPQEQTPTGDLLQGMLGYHLQCRLG